VHMDNTPASFVALFQNRPNNTGASKPETSIAVPATHKLTSCGIYKANNRTIIETIATDNRLSSNIFLLVTFFTLGLMISFTIEEAPAIKNESAVEITVASNAIIITMIIGNGSKLPMTS